jgi:predicted polyphosphate/ATP-dependent NAD kinase|tara:strand:+ start:3755 stop:4744 length:990 start_codon:yes stop_codon:yes gene_type:complete
LGSVGIIANPAAGKDIRRLVAQGRFVPNHEKVNVLKRVLAGLDAVGVETVVFMPDSAQLGRGALDGENYGLDVEFVEMSIFHAEEDSTRAAAAMREAGVGCLITLGGDGTNRVVAKGCGDVPIMPISTGTNNVFPSMIEGTVAGMAAGQLANGAVDPDLATTRSARLELLIDGDLHDIALVDLAVSTERFVGARAIWDIDTLHEVFLCRAEPVNIGISAIGAQLHPIPLGTPEGLRIRFGTATESVLAPVAPGMVREVGIESWEVLAPGQLRGVNLRPGTIALDGERSLSLTGDHEVAVRVSTDGPRVVDVDRTLASAVAARRAEADAR